MNGGEIRGPADKNNDKRASNAAPNDNVLRSQAGGAENFRRRRCGQNKFVSVNEDLRVREPFGERKKKEIKIFAVNDEGALVQRWPYLNCRQDQLGLLMQHNEMASSGKKGSSTQLQRTEHSLI